MHEGAFRYMLTQITDLVPAGATVLEVGSYNVNGSVRGVFRRPASYLGVDLRAGPGVDLVADLVADPSAAPGPFDVVVSTETLEHAADPSALLAAMWKRLRPGGLLLLTAAAPERAEHGMDGGDLPPEEPYQAIDSAWLYEQLQAFRPRFYAGHHDADLGDIYASAVKEEEPDGTTEPRALPSDPSAD